MGPAALRELFIEHGHTPSYATVVRSRSTTREGKPYSRSRGYGFVEFGAKRAQADIDREEKELAAHPQVDDDEEGSRPKRVKQFKHRSELTP